MTSVEDELRSILHSLGRAGAEAALVGGLAVSVRAEPRLTRDADLVVSVGDDTEAEKLLASLRTGGYQIETLIEHEPTGRLATARLTRSSVGAGVLADLLFASSGIEPEIVAAAETLSVVPGLLCPVAVLGDLVAMKLLARDDRHRPNDADDLRQLAAVASPADWARAEVSVRLIEQRGFDRGRDLPAALAQLRATGG